MVKTNPSGLSAALSTVQRLLQEQRSLIELKANTRVLWIIIRKWYNICHMCNSAKVLCVVIVCVCVCVCVHVCTHMQVLCSRIVMSIYTSYAHASGCVNKTEVTTSGT